MTTITSNLLPLSPLLLWLLLVAWSPSRLEGEPLLTTSIPLLARAKMVFLPFVAGIVVMIASTILSDAHWLSALLLLLSILVVLCVPINYVLTTSGIRCGKGEFRRWTEFAGVRRSTSGAILQGGPRSSSYPIFLSGSREDDEFVLALKNLIVASYKGTTIERNQRLGEDRQR